MKARPPARPDTPRPDRLSSLRAKQSTPLAPSLRVEASRFAETDTAGTSVRAGETDIDDEGDRHDHDDDRGRGERRGRDGVTIDAPNAREQRGGRGEPAPLTKRRRRRRKAKSDRKPHGGARATKPADDRASNGQTNPGDAGPQPIGAGSAPARDAPHLAASGRKDGAQDGGGRTKSSSAGAAPDGAGEALRGPRKPRRRRSRRRGSHPHDQGEAPNARPRSESDARAEGPTVPLSPSGRDPGSPGKGLDGQNSRTNAESSTEPFGSDAFRHGVREGPAAIQRADDEKMPGPLSRHEMPTTSQPAGNRSGFADASHAPATGHGGQVHRSPAYAALDLGTNNCRLLIAIPTRPGQFRVIDAFSRIVRLGEGLGRTGSLSRGAMDRAIAALAICAQKLAARDVDRCRLIATEACRQAANGAEFIEEVEAKTGLTLEIVSRETEARLAVSGCGSLIDRKARGAVLFDIGGGSSEIALLDLRDNDRRQLSKRIVAWTSLPVGVVTLAERHGGRNVTPDLFETMIAETVAMIEKFPGRGRLGGLVGSERFHLIGTSGTVTTLAGVHLELERYDRRQVDGLWLSDGQADQLVAKIAGWSFEERVANPCIGSDRADLVLAGCAILQAIRRVWPARALRVADRGLREGLLTEMMVADGAWRRDRRT